MTVTLPRALEVCGVTRSIRCPFKCVPTRASCTARWNPISPHFYILLSPSFAIHCIDLERKGVQGFLGTRSGSESSAQRTRVAPFQRSSSPHMLSPSSTGHHCLKDQYLCSSKYWLLWPCLIIFCRHQLRCIVTINCFYNRAHALIGMRKMDTKWASPHFLIDTPMMPSFDGWPWNSVSLRIDLYKLPVWLQIMTNSQLMWIDGTVTSQRFTLNKQSQNTKYTPTPKQKVQ